MPTKHTLADVIKETEELGFKFLSTEYMGQDGVYKFKCPNNHTFETSFRIFTRPHKYRCQKCAIDNRKVPIQDILNLIKKREFTLLQDFEYKNKDTPIQVQCSKGHQFKTSYHSLLYYGCNKCSGRERKTKQEIQKEFPNLELLDDYINAHANLKWKCNVCNHTFCNSYYKICTLKTICPECRKKRISRRIKDFSAIVKEIEKESYTYVSGEYKNNRSNLKLLCAEQHPVTMSWFDWWTMGYRCSTCNKIQKENELKEYMAKYLAENGVKLLNVVDKFKRGRLGIDYLLEIECKKKHITQTNWSYLYYLKRFCSKCRAKTNKPEKEILEFLVNIGIEVDQHNKDILNGKELDLYLPEYHTAIEYNGLYWHSDCCVSDRYRHFKKQEVCLRKNIDLITIWQGEWETRKEAVKNIILKRLHKVQKIKLKKCTIEEIDYIEAHKFMEDNHVFSILESDKSIALKNNDGKLLSVLSYVNAESVVQVAQFCDLIGYQVCGSFSKILTELIELEKPTKIVSFVDRRYFTEDVLVRNGFKKINLKLGHKWTDLQKIYNEHSNDRRSHRIYDNGQVEYVKIINQG